MKLPVEQAIQLLPDLLNFMGHSSESLTYIISVAFKVLL